MSFVVIDFETANEKRSSACSIGYAIVEDNSIVETGHEFIKPEPFYFDSFNVSIHGIDYEDVENAKNIVDVWNSLKDKFKDKIFVAHNASFDMSVLRNGFASFEKEYPELKYVCSCKIAEKTIPNLINYKLTTLADKMNIEFNHHNAESDAMATALIMINILKDNEVSSIEELLDKFGMIIGEIKSDSYNRFMPSKRVRTCLSKIEANEEINEDSDLFGKKVVFTGTLESMERKQAAQIVANCGGKTMTSISKTTNYLVVGVQDYRQFADGATMSSKMKKALELSEAGSGIQIITEDDFLKMI